MVFVIWVDRKANLIGTSVFLGIHIYSSLLHVIALKLQVSDQEITTLIR